MRKRDGVPIATIFPGPTDVKTGVSQKGSNSLVRELVTILGVNGFTPHEMEIK